ncbi:MAG: hypothetical protein ACD_37C00366G0006 [uncultured bacterium]|nr:MAG: hypothetical protein ACD_37C00366G0006 [uncultured bacterium]
MKDLKKKRKYILIAISIGTVALILWVAFLIWYLTGITNKPTVSQQREIDAVEQGKSDRYFAELEKQFIIDHPWSDKLPLSTDKYFLFYNPINDTFGADLYLDPNSPAEEINSVKQEVLGYLSAIGVNVSGAKFSWSFIKSPNLEL